MSPPEPPLEVPPAPLDAPPLPPAPPAPPVDAPAEPEAPPLVAPLLPALCALACAVQKDSANMEEYVTSLSADEATVIRDTFGWEIRATFSYNAKQNRPPQAMRKTGRRTAAPNVV